MKLLGFDTSTEACAVGVLSDGAMFHTRRTDAAPAYRMRVAVER